MKETPFILSPVITEKNIADYFPSQVPIENNQFAD